MTPLRPLETEAVPVPAKGKKNRKFKSAMPQPRHVWGINPKTRVKPSKKKYARGHEKKQEKSWVDELLE
ncbi:MAG: hypothetical protein A2Z83_04155 [Omnitrophica bacterium GWA2_52_8]|nr:MAG: hypothetical protein A2Z83_04155 [Omnitrophica bacterium GWA2_52_8]